MILILAILLLTAPGCWRGRELDARAFVTAVAFDLTTGEGADPDEFLLSIQVPIPAKMAGEGGDQG
ncbi:MAG TPA: Ger(x)C family spore germination protein, partial [Firmicutes bacterium]|nr:Ger(x)C family spore germination protein [Bacillota bacterium]